MSEIENAVEICSTIKCCSGDLAKEHADRISAAITQYSTSDHQICSYIDSVCKDCASVRDSDGRTALHVAASCGRRGIVRWLVTKRHADIEAKDHESGYTALHRAAFYGQIGVLVELIKRGKDKPT